MFLTKHIYPRLAIKFSRLCFALTAVQVAVVHLHVIYTQSSIGEEFEANILYKKRERVAVSQFAYIYYAL